MKKATGEDWRRYYEAGARRRRAIGGDHIRLHQERELAKDRRALVVASLFLLGLLMTFYAILAR